MKPCSKGEGLHSVPLGHRVPWEGFPIVSEHNISPSVLTLLVLSFPSTVFWIVSLIVVVSFDAVFGGRLSSHISKEISERYFPPSAYLDPTSAVVRPSYGFGIVTPLDHVGPRAVFSGPESSPTPPMDGPRGLLLYGMATAGNGLTFYKVCVTNDTHRPASTFAIPEGNPTLSSCVAHNHPSFNAPSRKVEFRFAGWIMVEYMGYSFWHGSHMLRVSKGHSAPTGGLCAATVSPKLKESTPW